MTTTTMKILFEDEKMITQTKCVVDDEDGGDYNSDDGGDIVKSLIIYRG